MSIKPETMQSGMIKAMVAVLTALIIYFTVWITRQTQINSEHIIEQGKQISVENLKVLTALEKLSQMVYDGKEARLTSEKVNTSQHESIILKLDSFVTKREFDAKIDGIESNIKYNTDRIGTMDIRLNKAEDTIGYTKKVN